MATGGALLTLLGMGGQIASGLVAENQAQSAASTARQRARESRALVASEVNPLANPLIAALVANQLAGLGIVDPSLLQNAGPIGRTMEAIRAAGLTGQEQFGAIALLADLQSGVESGDLTLAEAENIFRSNISHQFVRQFGGFETFGELMSAEQAYQQQIQPVLANLESIRSGGLQRQEIINRALLGLTEDVAAGTDLASVREAERARLQRDLDERRARSLRQANIGGFNPASEFRALQEAETDADLIALERAVGLVTGQQSTQANALRLLLGLNPATPIENLSGILPQAGTLADQNVNAVAAQLEAAGGFAAAQGAMNVSQQTTAMGLSAMGSSAALGGSGLGIGQFAPAAGG